MITTVFFTLIDAGLALIFYSILVSAVISLLLTFDIIDRRNRFVWSVQDFLTRFCEPILLPFRRRIPTFNGLDLSPWVVLILIQILRGIVLPYFAAGFHGYWGPLF